MEIGNSLCCIKLQHHFCSFVAVIHPLVVVEWYLGAQMYNRFVCLFVHGYLMAKIAILKSKKKKNKTKKALTNPKSNVVDDDDEKWMNEWK